MINVSPPHETVVRGRITLPVAPKVVFALLSDPGAHAELDGSRSIRGVLEAPDRLVLGSRFRMRMKGYVTDNVVVEYRPDELISWRHRGRHVWRWQLSAVPGGTAVTETFDYRDKRAHAVVRALGIPGRARTAIDTTLAALAARFEQVDQCEPE